MGKQAKASNAMNLLCDSSLVALISFLIYLNLNIPFTLQNSLLEPFRQTGRRLRLIQANSPYFLYPNNI